MEGRHKTLIILSPGFPESEADTTCLTAQQELVKSINALYGKLDLIILSFQYPFVSKPYSWNGNRIIPFNGRSKGKIYRLGVWARVWQMLKKLNREGEVIGILSFWCTECALLGKYFEKKYAIKHFIWILGQDAGKKNDFVSWIKPAPEDLLAMSPFLADKFYENHHIKPAHFIPNGVSVSSFPSPNLNKDIDLLGVGSLIPLKQYDGFIRVVKKLKASLSDISAVICGKGPEENYLRKMILDSDLQKNISLTGERPHDEVLQWMSRSRVLLHPSSYEGFSTVCLEALCAGAHVISFCDPKTGSIPHWHIVKNEEEMAALASRIIQQQNTDYSPVLKYTMDGSAKKLMELFHYHES